MALQGGWAATAKTPEAATPLQLLNIAKRKQLHWGEPMKAGAASQNFFTWLIRAPMLLAA